MDFARIDTDYIHLVVQHARRGEISAVAAADRDPPFYRESAHVCGGEDCLIGIYSVVRGVKSKVCPIPSGHRPSYRDYRAKQHACPHTTAHRDRPSQNVFFDDFAAAVVEPSTTDCFSNKANNIHSLVLLLFALDCVPLLRLLREVAS